MASEGSPIEFYVGVHQPHDASHFERVCVSINRIRERRSTFPVNRWIMDSGAFTEISRYGLYRHAVEDYARAALRWIGVGHLEAIVGQDYMCEPFILRRTGLTVADHQRLTIERYDALRALIPPGVHVMPTLQGFDPSDYSRHVRAYGDRLTPGMWVGVGSVCKRNGSPIDVLNVLARIKQVRPDLRLHGFGVKRTALLHGGVRELLGTADSMAWSLHARMCGRNGNDWREAKKFEESVNQAAAQAGGSWQMSLELEIA